MPCAIKNPSNIDLTDLEPHVHGVYDYFDQKIGFNKPPTMVFDSDPTNQPNVLGKTAAYDPQTLQIHVYTDGRHPKDMLRSIAHELIHHWQNEEGRLDVGGYSGPGYYLKNKDLNKLEKEAMELGNGYLREYEDKKKLEEKKRMSIKEWKNNELNQRLMKRFGIIKEQKDAGCPPGKRWEGAEEGEEGGKCVELQEENIEETNLYKRDDDLEEAADKNTGMSGVAGDDKDDTYMGHIKEDSGEDEAWHDWKNEHADDDHIKEIEHHLRSLKDDRDYEREGSEYDDDDYEDDRKDESLKEGGRKRKDPRNRRWKEDERFRPLQEDSGEEEAWHDWKNEHADDDHIREIEHHLRALKDDRDYEEEGAEYDKDKYEDDRMDEDDDSKGLNPMLSPKEEEEWQRINPATVNESLRNRVKKVLKKNKKLRLRFK